MRGRGRDRLNEKKLKKLERELTVESSGHRSLHSDYYKKKGGKTTMRRRAKKKKTRARATGPGWRVNGSSVYKVKGTKPSRRKTYKTKREAKKHIHR